MTWYTASMLLLRVFQLLLGPAVEIPIGTTMMLQFLRVVGQECSVAGQQLACQRGGLSLPPPACTLCHPGIHTMPPWHTAATPGMHTLAYLSSQDAPLTCYSVHACIAVQLPIVLLSPSGGQEGQLSLCVNAWLIPSRPSSSRTWRIFV